MRDRGRLLSSPTVPAVLFAVLIVLAVGAMLLTTTLPLPECWRAAPGATVAECLWGAVKRTAPPELQKLFLIPPAAVLNWQDNAGGAAGFRIERKTGSGGTFALLAEVPPGTTTYTDAAVATSTTYCYRVRAFNEAGESGYSNEACSTIASAGLTLTVNVSGTGTVTSSPSGIACPPTCSKTFPATSAVTLTATPGGGGTFLGWGGGCTGTTATCSVLGNAPVTVAATFGAPISASIVIGGNPATGPYSVEATTTAPGDVRVEFLVDGASYRVENDPPYTLFAGTGTLGPGAHTIIALVYPQTGTTLLAQATAAVTEGTPPAPPPTPPPTSYPATVYRKGQGIITAPGITCGADCTESYPAGSVVTFTAVPRDGWRLLQWSGACSGSAPTCTVTISGPVGLEAAFGRTK